jgi:hypothetical protein
MGVGRLVTWGGAKHGATQQPPVLLALTPGTKTDRAQDRRTQPDDSTSAAHAGMAHAIALLKQTIESQRLQIQQLEEQPRQSVTITQNNYLIVNSFGKETIGLDETALENGFWPKQAD